MQKIAKLFLLRIYRHVAYSLWLLREIAISSLDVSLKMWQLEPDISPQVEFIPTKIKNETQMAIFANSITLTPGTVALDINGDGEVYVHSLTEESMKMLKKGKLLQKVKNLAEHKK